MATKILSEVACFTDGAARGNPGIGGFAAILIAQERERELAGGYMHTTNNRAELSAVLLGLKALRQPCQVNLYTDSTYVIQGIQSAHKWQQRFWWRSAKDPVPNYDLWEQFLLVAEPHVLIPVTCRITLPLRQ